MNLDLTAQFLRDYEKLRQEAENPPASSASPEEIKRLEEDVERLEAVIEELNARHQEAAVRRDAEFERVRAEYEGREGQLRKTHAEKLGQKELELKQAEAECAVKVREIKEAAHSEIAEKIRAHLEEAKKKNATEQSATLALLNAKLESTRDQVVSEIEGSLARLAYVPLRMRVSALVLDVLILAVACATVRIGTAWGRDLAETTFILAFFALFSLRAFVSPGSLLLGISARRIGPDHRPNGPPGFKARLICGLLHYGPLIATVVVAALDDETARGLKKLVQWAFDPGSEMQTLPRLVLELLRPASPGLPGAILASTFIWWIVLFLSILFSSLIHRGTPYFRNTTLVEYIERVGFQRFSPPALKSPSASVAS